MTDSPSSALPVADSQGVAVRGPLVDGPERAPLAEWMIPIDSAAVVLTLAVPGDPVAHQRPRFTRTGHTYTPEKSRSFKLGIAALIKAKIPTARDPLSKFGVQARFYRSNRQRIDADNLLKSVLDACTQSGIWKDDSQVVELAARVWLAQAVPRLEFIVYLAPDPSPGKPCPQCGKETRFGKLSKRIYCSRACANASKRISLVCRQCRRPFDIPRCKVKGNPGYPRAFCSRECSIEAFRALKRIKGKESDTWRCGVCGGRVSRKEYKQCRACSIKGRRAPTGKYWKLRHIADSRPVAASKSRPGAAPPEQGEIAL